MKKEIVAIIIITYNSQNQISNCLKSIEQCAIDNEMEKKIIIIDNNSTDSTLKIIQSGNFDPEIIANKKNIGFAKAVNQGIKLAIEKIGADFLLLLNPDATLSKQCLSTLLKSWKEEKRIGAMSPLIIDPTDKKPWFSGAKINWLRMSTNHNIHPSSKTDYLTGCVLLLSKNTIQRVGHFDEAFFLYYEDADFSTRIKKAGLSLVIEPKAIAHHEESQSSTPSTKNYCLVKSGLLFFRKHYPKLLLPYFWTIFYLRYFYHQNISKKEIVIKALQDFKKEFTKRKYLL